MNRRVILTVAAIGAIAAASGVNVRMADAAPQEQSLSRQLLSRQWRHVSTLDAATGADLSAKLPQLSGNIVYLADGTYVSGDADHGSWSLSTDGSKLTLASSTFEYGVELSVERLDAGTLRVSSRQIAGSGTEPSVVVETFAPAVRQVVTAR